MKKILAAALAAAMTMSLAGCSSRNSSSSQLSSQTSSGSSSGGSSSATQPANTTQGGKIYYLNFKPEIAEVYNEIAKTYQDETGVEVTVVTAASGAYEQTLKSEISKAEPPTIFQINGPKGYASWKDYCADLKDTDLYQHLTDKALPLQMGMAFMGFHMSLKVMGLYIMTPLCRGILP